MSADLLPCPFCGRYPEQSSRADNSTSSGEAHFIACMCGGYSANAHQFGKTRKEVLSKWNRRAALAAKTEAPVLDDRKIADTVNDLRDIAFQFHSAQQLRERIAGVIVPLLKAAPAMTVEPVAVAYRTPLLPLADPCIRQRYTYFAPEETVSASEWKFAEALGRIVPAVQPVGEAAKCTGCNGYGMVGNIIDSDTCPFCEGSGEEAPAAAPCDRDAALAQYNEGYADGLLAIKDSVKAIRDRALNAALNCYSPDDLASDWGDKIRTMMSEPAGPQPVMGDKSGEVKS